MRDEDRGKIVHRDFASQLRDFSGLRFGKITPTDIDAFLDFNNQIFILIELKYGEAQLKYGQKLALQRLCDASQKSGITSFVLIAHHQTNKDIDAASLSVTSYYHKGKWKIPQENRTVRATIELIREFTHV